MISFSVWFCKTSSVQECTPYTVGLLFWQSSNGIPECSFRNGLCVLKGQSLRFESADCNCHAETHISVVGGLGCCDSEFTRQVDQHFDDDRQAIHNNDACKSTMTHEPQQNHMAHLQPHSMSGESGYTCFSTCQNMSVLVTQCTVIECKYTR
eukprot:5169298-Amphidinium_carterae.1